MNHCQELKNCLYVTTKGVREAIENSIALKELNLKNCSLVDGDYVCGLIYTRPSLRKIITLSGADFYG